MAVLGIDGAFLARYAGMEMGWYQQNEPAGWWMASVIGAVVLLFVYGLLKGKSRDVT